MVEIKTRNGIFVITEKDVVLFNGACWQLMSQTYRSGWDNLHPHLSATKCEKWLKKGALKLVKEDGLYTAPNGKQMGCWYYQPVMEILEKLGN